MVSSIWPMLVVPWGRPGQKPLPFLCQLLELLSCPFPSLWGARVIPAVLFWQIASTQELHPKVKWTYHYHQGSMQVSFCASRNKYTNTENCLPLPARLHFTARACLRGVKGINGSHKIFQVACHHLSCALCKWKQGAWYLPASVSHCWLMKISPKQTLGASEKCIHVVLENLQHLLTKTES